MLWAPHHGHSIPWCPTHGSWPTSCTGLVSLPGLGVCCSLDLLHFPMIFTCWIPPLIQGFVQMPPSPTGFLQPAGLNSFPCQSPCVLCPVSKLRQFLPSTWFSLLEITCGPVIYGCTATYPSSWWLKQEPFHCISPTCGSDMRAGLPGAPTGVFGRLGSARPGDRSAYTSRFQHGACRAVDFLQRPNGNHKASYDQASEGPECYFCTFCWSSKSQAQIRIKFRECRPHLLGKDWKRICGYVLVNYTSFYFWLHWVCIAACRLSQVAVSRCCLPCGGVSWCRVLAVGHSGFSSYRARA